MFYHLFLNLAQSQFKNLKFEHSNNANEQQNIIIKNILEQQQLHLKCSAYCFSHFDKIVIVFPLTQPVPVQYQELYYNMQYSLHQLLLKFSAMPQKQISTKNWRILNWLRHHFLHTVHHCLLYQVGVMTELEVILMQQHLFVMSTFQHSHSSNLIKYVVI